MTFHTVMVQVELPDFELPAIRRGGKTYVDRNEVGVALESWASSVVRAHGDGDIAMVLRAFASSLMDGPVKPA